MKRLFPIASFVLLCVTPLLAQVEGEAPDSAGPGTPVYGPAVNEEIVPASARTVMGGSSNSIPWSWTPTHFMAVYSGAELPQTPYSIGCLGLRSNNRTDTGATIDIEMWMGYTTLDNTTLTATYANNFNIPTKPPILVLKRQMIKLADNIKNTDPLFFQYQIPLDTAFPWIPTSGENFLIELKIYGNSNNNASFSMFLDNESGTTANASRLYSSNDANAVTGTLGVNYAPCISLFSKCKINSDFVQYGTSCPGTGGFSGVVLPAANAAQFANSSSYYPHGRGNMRLMQIHDASSITAPVVCTGLAFRQSSVSQGVAGGPQTLEITIGKTTSGVTSFNIDFAKNFDIGTPYSAFKGTVNLPTTTGVGTNPAEFVYRFPFAQPWVFTPASGHNLAFEVINTSTSNIISYADYNSLTTGTDMSQLYAFDATASYATSVLPGRGLVIGLMTAGGGSASPVLSNSGGPVINTSYDVTLSLAKDSSVAVHFLGFSDSLIGTKPLPLAIPQTSCFLYNSADLLIPVPTDVLGNAVVTLPVPNDTNLVGKSIFHQYMVLDAGANALGLVFTNGGKATFGEQ